MRADLEELQRMADFLSVRLGDPPPGKPKWVTDAEALLADADLTITYRRWLPHRENRRLPLPLDAV